MPKRHSASGGIAHVTGPVAHAGQRSIAILSITKFAGAHQVVWRDGRQKRKILIAIERWSEADQAVIDAVAATYPPDDRPQVTVPVKAWR